MKEGLTVIMILIAITVLIVHIIALMNPNQVRTNLRKSYSLKAKKSKCFQNNIQSSSIQIFHQLQFKIEEGR